MSRASCGSILEEVEEAPKGPITSFVHPPNAWAEGDPQARVHGKEGGGKSLKWVDNQWIEVEKKGSMSIEQVDNGTGDGAKEVARTAGGKAVGARAMRG